MNPADKSIIDYLIEYSEKRFDKLEKKVDRLWELKMMLVGGCIVVSAACTVIINLIIVYIGK